MTAPLMSAAGTGATVPLTVGLSGNDGKTDSIFSAPFGLTL
jgi:hypothetical protein